MFVKKDDTSSSLLTPADKKTETPKQYISTQSWDLDYPSATNHKSCPLWMGDEQMMKCHFLWCISPYCPLLNSLPPAPAASPSSPFQSLYHHHHISSGLSLPIFSCAELLLMSCLQLHWFMWNNLECLTSWHSWMRPWAEWKSKLWSYRSSYGALVLLKAPTTLELSIRCSIDTGQIITGWTQ